MKTLIKNARIHDSIHREPFDADILIEDGRLTRPIKDINIIGNGPQALADIAAVGNDLKVDDAAWTCGKGQSCPVSCGIPTVLINNLTVGGE